MVLQQRVLHREKAVEDRRQESEALGRSSSTAAPIAAVALERSTAILTLTLTSLPHASDQPKRSTDTAEL